MLVLCGILVAGAVWGWNSLFAEVPTEQAGANPTTRSCDTERLRVGQLLKSSQVKVSVFNAGTESGLADTTSTALSRRGFRIGKVGNAPSDSRVARVQVRSTKRSDLAARLVARQFGRQVPVRVSGQNLGPGVDVVVGNALRALAPTTRTIRAATAQKVCLSKQRS